MIGNTCSPKQYNGETCQLRIEFAQVDDYLPCVPRKQNEPGQKVFFADLSDGEMYVPLLEKAFAESEKGCLV